MELDSDEVIVTDFFEAYIEASMFLVYRALGRTNFSTTFLELALTVELALTIFLADG